MQDKVISIVGAGHLGSNVIRSLYESGHSKIIASRRDNEKLTELVNNFGSYTTTDNKEAAYKGEIIILTVKPKILYDVCEEIKDYCRDKLVISLAAARKLSDLEKILSKSRVARVMTGVFVNGEIATYSLGKNLSERDEDDIKYIFGSESIKVDEKIIEERTSLACYEGWISEQIKLFEKTHIGLTNEQIRKILGATFVKIGEFFSDGGTAEDLSNLVAGPGSFTGGIQERLTSKEVYTRMTEVIVDALDRLNQ